MVLRNSEGQRGLRRNSNIPNFKGRNRRIFYGIYVALVAECIGVTWMFLGMADPRLSSGSVPAGGGAGHPFLFGVLG